MAPSVLIAKAPHSTEVARSECVQISSVGCCSKKSQKKIGGRIGRCAPSRRLSTDATHRGASAEPASSQVQRSLAMLQK